MNQLTRQIADRLSTLHDYLFDLQNRAADRVASVLDWYFQQLLDVDVGTRTPYANVPRKVDGLFREFFNRLVDSYYHEWAGIVTEADERVRGVITGILSASNIIPVKPILIKPPSARQIQSILSYQNLLGRIEPLTRMASPQTMTSILLQSHIQGQDRRQLARTLESTLHMAKVGARRIARTAGALITTQVNLLSFAGLGDLLAGYQLHAVKDKASRRWHASRDRVIYWLEPREGQKGLYQMPSPPYEPSDPKERPVGTPQLAYNCRCFLSPVFRM